MCGLEYEMKLKNGATNEGPTTSEPEQLLILKTRNNRD